MDITKNAECYKYEDKTINALILQNKGEEDRFFSAKDVLTACGYKQTKKKQIETFLKKNISEDFFIEVSDELFINLGGICELMMISKKEECIKFRRWVCSEILTKRQAIKDTSLPLSKDKGESSRNEDRSKGEVLEQIGDEYIYIATSKNYAKENIFKVGGSGSDESFEKRIIGYNTGRPVADKMFFCYKIKVLKFTEIEKRLRSLCSEIKGEQNEMYNIHLDYLIPLIESVVRGYNGEQKILSAYLNDKDIKNRPPAEVEDIFNKKDAFVFSIGDDGNYSDADKLKIWSVIHKILIELTIKGQPKTRTSLFDMMESEGHKFNRRDMWKLVKELKIDIKY